MSQDSPIPRQDDRSDGAAVLEWGTTEPAPRRLGGQLGGLARDPRLPRVLAGLGAAAAFASLVGEWLVTTVPNSGPEGDSIRVPAGVDEVGGFGIGYLVALLGLAGTVALATGGTRDVRRNARVLGTALAVALLALLAAATLSLDDPTQAALYYPNDSGFEVEYGRGLVMAFVAVALLGAALRLPAADPRRADGQPDRPAEPAEGAEGAEGDEPAGTGPTGPENRRWRPRRRGSREPEDVPPAPEGLTVQPSVPFARPEPPSGRS
ncbi:hypothetical protein [Micromonospora cathayae]|uniref:Tryptophan-associated transmembrane protein (Trp_oprn_chp) n=1 Tax=Micromonospora cathayae TaxID=3028804 RepID=A0ABY7ZU65_9ACTN|nr:hypothetical protein [Micromonospora sp. HUAS 3]WDZ85946.1 hypothetical protein PVK37_05830 [Micromonospora sp. HUAS 3]